MDKKIKSGLFKIAKTVAIIATVLFVFVLLGYFAIPGLVKFRHILGYGIICLVLWVIAAWDIFSKLKVMKGKKLSSLLSVISMCLAGFYFIMWIVKLIAPQKVASHNPLGGAIFFLAVSIICLFWDKIVKFVNGLFVNDDEEAEDKTKKSKAKKDDDDDDDDKEDENDLKLKKLQANQTALYNVLKQLTDESLPFENQYIATMTKSELVELITQVSAKVVVEMLKKEEEASK
ncbi:MAG: hypothetical protein MJ232_05185 [archaeon]|nr:hypothetical protein [archaeon]